MSLTRRTVLQRSALGLVSGGLVATSVRFSAEAQDASPAASPQPQLPVTVINADGSSVTVSDVSRIVPLTGDVAEIVWALGLGANVVGVDISATYPPEAAAFPTKIGYQRALSAEGILGLNPTVLIGTDVAGPPPVIAQLQSSGVPVVILPSNESTIDTAAAKIRGVAAALGVVEAGEQVATSTEADIAAAQALVANVSEAPSVMFIFLQGQGTQIVAGGGTVADALLGGAKARNAASEAGLQGYVPLSAEALVTAQPEVIVTTEGSLASVGGVEGFRQLPGIAETPAGQNGRVLAFDDLYLLGLTPRAGQALADLIRGIYPELAATPVASPEAATPVG